MRSKSFELNVQKLYQNSEYRRKAANSGLLCILKQNAILIILYH